MSKGGAEDSKEYRTCDTVLVRIAERPLVVVGLFLFTALFPWLLYFLVPILAKATLVDLIQWLTLPILFLLVNGLLFFLWINSKSGGDGAAAPRQQESVLDEIFKKPRAIDIPIPEETPPPPSSSLSSSSASEYEQEEEEEAKVMPAAPAMDPLPVLEPVMKGHHKSLSLGGNVKLDPKLLQEVQSSNVSRRNSAPKSKTPEPGKPRVSRRNSSPKSVTPSSIKFQKKQRSETLHECYTPPLRISHQPPPIPLDKDDLNNRIENFLTKFKIERQESNLRAALKQ